MTFRLAGAGHAIVGARTAQEDSFGFWPPEGSAIGLNGAGLLALVADGMGGHRGGALASRTASSEFLGAFSSQNGAIGDRLGRALQAGNAGILRESSNDPNLRGMGCTLVAAWLDEEGLRWISVGDSLLLLCRFPSVIRLNADHSLGSFLDEQVRLNQISEREARDNKHRHALRSALTGKHIDIVDLRGEPFELKSGDWLLMASDGIFTLTGDEIGDIVFGHRNASPQEMAEALTAAVAAKRATEQDNTTVIAVHISEHSAVPLDDAITRIVRAPSQPVDLTTVKTRPMLAPAEAARLPGAPNPVSQALARLEDGMSNAGAWVYFVGLAALLVVGAALVYMLSDGTPSNEAKRNPSPPVARNEPAGVPQPAPPQAQPQPQTQPQEQAQPPPPVAKRTQAGADTPPGGNPSAPHTSEGAHRSGPTPQPEPPPMKPQSDRRSEADLALGDNGRLRVRP